MKAAAYNFISQYENSFWYYYARHQLIQSFLEKLCLSQDSYILDGGCGTGYFTNQLQLKYKKIIGLEISSLGIKYCRRFKSSYYIQGNLNNPPFQSDKFDAVICSDVLYHQWINIDIVYAQIKRILKKNGFLMVHDAAFNFWSNELDDGQQMLKKRFNKKDIKRLAKKFDFEIVKFTYTSFFMFIPAIIIFLKRRFLPQKRNPQNSEIKFTPINPLLNNLILLLYKLEQIILKRFSLPIGVNCFYIMRSK